VRWRLFVFTIRAIFILYFIVGLLLYIFQRSLIYHPTPKVDYTYKRELFHNAEQDFSTIVLNEGKDRAIIYFGGNGEQVHYNADNFLDAFPSYTIYLVDYRGYGWSRGTPTEEGIYSDALFLYDSIHGKYQEVYLVGRSLGTGVVSYISSKRDINKVALITPFDSLQNVAQKLYPYYPMGILLKDKYNSKTYLTQKAPKHILVMMASDDEIVPNKNTQNLVESLPKEVVTLHTIKETSHNSISSTMDYYDTLSMFFQGYQ